MAWHIVLKFLDANDAVLATEDVVDPRALTWKIPAKSAMVRAEEKHAKVQWTKVSLMIEKA